MAEQVESAENRTANEDPEAESELPAPVPWRGFAGPFSSIHLAAQRFGQSWRLLLAVELGMIVAVSLLATAPFYSDLVSSTQLQSTLTSAVSTDRNIQVDVVVPLLWDPQNTTVTRLANIDQTVVADAQNSITSFTAGSTEYLDTTRPLLITQIGGKSPVFVSGGYCNNVYQYAACQGGQILPMAYDYTQATPHMKLVAGRLPKETAATATPEVMVTPAMGVKPGTTLQFVDSATNKFHFKALVVGVWTPKDATDPFWNGKGFETLILPNLRNAPPPQYPVLFTRQALTQWLTYKPFGPSVAPMGAGLHYIYFVSSNSITVTQVSGVRDDVAALRRTLDTDVPGSYGAESVAVGTHLADLLSSVVGLFAAQTLPLYSVDAELVALALLFIFVMAGLLIESQSGEIATLKSRGASTLQVLLTYLSQGLLLGAVALVVGVAAAGALALVLVRFFVPLSQAVSAALSPAYVARSVSLRDALIPAAIGAGLGVAALGLATWQAARMDTLAFRREQGRSARVPFWKRYYLDIGLAVLCIAGYTELITFGGLTTRVLVNSTTGASQTPGGQADIIQLLAPTLMLLAGALLLQRALPWLVRLGAWLTARGRGATSMLAFSQVSRASGAFSRLTLLLTLAVGLGLFSLTFQSTIARGAHDNAYYLTGADERVSIKPQSEGTQSTLGYAAAFAKMPGVQSVTPLYRGIALTLPNQGGQNVDILGVDPATFAQTATWRGDYASQSLPALMNTLARAPHGSSLGLAGSPMTSIVDQQFASNFALQVGQRFQLSPQEAGQSNTSTSAYFVVSAIVNNFPTLYDEYGTGCVVVDLNDYLATLANPNVADYTVNGPNDFLLRATPDAHDTALRAKTLTDPNFFVQQTQDARALTTLYRNDPLAAGMSGLLLLGALIAALLALVGVITQAAIATRQRQTQFAILRTLGLSEGALTRMLLTEQALVYVLGALGGVVIGALLAGASLPFLGFTTSTYTPPVLGVPSSQLAVNLNGSLLYLAALLVIFVVALVIAAGVARATGLGRALRVGED